MTNRPLSPIARSRIAKAKAEAKAAKHEADAPIRAARAANVARTRAANDVASVEHHLLEAEAAEAKWRKSLADTKAVMGARADPADLLDCQRRIDIALEAIATHRKELVVAQACLDALPDPNAIAAPAPAKKEKAQ